MKRRILLSCIAPFALAASLGAQTKADPMIPHLEKRGAATQLIVDGRPWLALAGETANTASSSLQYMDTAWPKIVKMNANTVLVAVAWDWVEPVEGKYDFTLLTGFSRAPGNTTCESSSSGSAVGRTACPASRRHGSKPTRRGSRATCSETASRWKSSRP